MNEFRQWCDRALELGATNIDGGINWTWAEGFPTKEIAQQFIDEFPRMETRGVYPPHHGSGWSVRFR